MTDFNLDLSLDSILIGEQLDQQLFKYTTKSIMEFEDIKESVHMLHVYKFLSTGKRDKILSELGDRIISYIEKFNDKTVIFREKE